VVTVVAAFAAVLLVAGPAGAATTRTYQRSFGPLATLTGQVIPRLFVDTDLGPVAPTQEVHVLVALRHDDAALSAFERGQYDPSSASYHQWLTPDEFQARFDAAPDRLAQIRSYVTRDGMQLFNADGMGDLTLATGTAEQAERTFGVAIHSFRSPHGHLFFANTTGPVVPANAGVVGVIGLQSFLQLQLASRGKDAGANETDQGQCAGGVCTGLLSPKDLWSVYDQPSSDMGQGESVGIIGEGQTTDVIHALREFEATRDLPHVPVQVYLTDPGAMTDDSGRVEWELDTQAATGMAPDVSQVRMYFGSSLQLSTLAQSLQAWASDAKGPNQVNASLGTCEDNPALDGLLGPSQAASGFALAQAAAEGRSFFAAAGDTGAGCALVVAENGITYGAVPTADYPGADPNATSVGGTVVYTDGAVQPSLVNEHAWDHTGGTRSDFIAAPDFQKVVPQLAVPCASQPNGTPYGDPTTPCRGTADVAALSGDATIVVDHKAPGTVQANGYDMVDDAMTADGRDAFADHFSEGGTSLSSPLWTGMWARVNAAHAGGPLGRVNSTIYPIASGATGASAFNDVTIGANPLPATPGWDFPTGWGSPNVRGLMKAADKGRLTPVHNVMPKNGPDPAPILAKGPNYGCPATFVDGAGDATSLPQSAPQLDILHGDLALASDGTTLRVGMTVDDLTATLPQGWTTMDYIVDWTKPATGVAPPATYTTDDWAAQVSVDSSGAITYTDGTIAFDDQGDSQYTSANTVTGSFHPGKNGTIEIDVPLAHVGGPKKGASLGVVGGQTDESNPATGLIVDTASTAKEYTLGAKSCLST
jgi:hypothetical protein